MANYTNSTPVEQDTLTGLFKDKESAERAYELVIEMGYSPAEASVLMSDETRYRYFRDESSAEAELGNKAIEGAGMGVAIGGVIGGLVGAIAAVGISVPLPGLGLVVAGPLAAALAGASAGGVTGGLLGALIGYGIPEDSAKQYEASIRGGGILLSVLPRNKADAERIDREWKQLGGEVLRR